MLVVKVEVWPGGREHAAVEVASLYAGNISDLADVSDYSVRGAEYGAKHLGIPRTCASFTIEGHNRKQSVLHLVEKMCKGYLENQENDD